MRLKWIDSLRGFASVAVVLYHVWNRYYPGATTQAHVGTLPHSVVDFCTLLLFGFGYLGVNLFFVLSGFCIHLPQAKRFRESGSDELRLGEFARRRFWRLYPAYLASLFWTSGVLVLFPLLNHFVRHVPFSVAQAGDLKSLLANAFFLQMFFPKSLDFNGVYWTLLFEFQFYLFYPVLLWIHRRIGGLPLFCVLLGTEIVLLTHPVPIKTFFAIRLFEWFLGMCLAELVSRPLRIPSFAFPVLLAVTLASLFSKTMWPYRDILGSLAFAALVGAGIAGRGFPEWLDRPRFVRLGLISYSLYLIHVPMIDLFWNGTSLAHKYSIPVPGFVVLLSIPASLITAHFFYKCFEKPFLRGWPMRQPVVAEDTFAPATAKAWAEV